MNSLFPLLEKFSQRFGLEEEASTATSYWWHNELEEEEQAYKQLFAVCDLYNKCYHFRLASLPEFKFLKQEPISLEDFEQLVDVDDRSHFEQARSKAMTYLLSRHNVQLGNLSLIFECRIRDRMGVAHPMLFCYRLHSTIDPNQPNTLVLSLIPIKYKKTNALSDIYIVDIIERKLVRLFGSNHLIKSERMDFPLLQQGDVMKEVADMLGLDYETVKRCHRNVQLKLGCENDEQATDILHFMGLI